MNDEVAVDGISVEVGAGTLGTEGVRVFLLMKRDGFATIGGYLPADKARALAALLVKHADRAEGK